MKLNSFFRESEKTKHRSRNTSTVGDKCKFKKVPCTEPVAIVLIGEISARDSPRYGRRGGKVHDSLWKTAKIDEYYRWSDSTNKRE